MVVGDGDDVVVIFEVVVVLVDFVVFVGLGFVVVRVGLLVVVG